MRDGLEAAYRHINEEIRLLFDPDHEYACVWPTHACLIQVIAMINQDLPIDTYRAADFLGWIYQFFNREEKKRVRDETKGTPRSSYELSVINQFYTPSWVVKALVDNTLGRLWLQMHPDSALRSKAPPPSPGQRTDNRPLADYLVPRTGERIRYQRLGDTGAVERFKLARDIRLLDPAERLFAEDTARGLKLLRTLSRSYDVVVMNPPYGAFVPKVKEFVKAACPLTKNDIYAAFIDRATQLIEPEGYVGALVLATFVNLKSFEKLRTEILLKRNPLLVMLLENARRTCTIVRMKIVSDTNIFLAVALDEPEKNRIIELTSGADVVAPEILHYEIGNALSAMIKRKRLTPEQALSAQASASLIPVRLVSVDIRQALQLAMDFNLYAYDAYFLHCAKSLSHPLITLDDRMKQVADELKIEVLE